MKPVTENEIRNVVAACSDYFKRRAVPPEFVKRFLEEAKERYVGRPREEVVKECAERFQRELEELREKEGA